MRFNRSVPPCQVIPVLRYPDPGVAAEWLCRAFGFSVRLRIANHRIQMRAGKGCFTIAQGTVMPNDSSFVQVRIDDAQSHCARARMGGTKILKEPADHMYGERQYDAEDFHGHRWNFTETIADAEPESWGRYRGEPLIGATQLRRRAAASAHIQFRSGPVQSIFVTFGSFRRIATARQRPIRFGCRPC